MNDLARRTRNTSRLLECHGPFAARVIRLISDLEGRGSRPRIQEAFRSLAEEQQAVGSGHSQVHWSFHNATTPAGRPDALAVDLLDDDYPVPAEHQDEWPESFRHYVLSLASLAGTLQLETGIAWGLSADERRVLGIALANDPLSYVGPLGWDVCHVEPRDLTLAAAKAGKRPVW